MGKQPFLNQGGLIAVFPGRFEIIAPSNKVFTTIVKTPRGKGGTDFVIMIGATKKVLVNINKGNRPFISFFGQK